MLACDVAVEHGGGEAVDDVLVEGALHRACAILRLVGHEGKAFHRILARAERDALFGKPLDEFAQLQAQDGVDVVARERVEDDDVVDAVDELRQHAAAQFGDDVLAQLLHAFGRGIGA